MYLPLSLRTDQSLGGERSLCLAQGSPSTRQPSQWHRSVLTLFPDVEWMPIHTRACVGTLTGYVYSLGQFLLAGVALAVPHWRHLQLLVSVPFFAFFIYSWCVGAQGGQGCPRAAQKLQGTGIPQPHHTLHHTKSEKIKARRSNPSQCLRVTDGKTEAVGGMIWAPLPQGLGSSASPSSLACLHCCLYPTSKS